jgi:hypothetical protein
VFSFNQKSNLHACGVRGTTTYEEPLIILEFTRFEDFYTFNKNELNFEEKTLIRGITVLVGI